MNSVLAVSNVLFLSVFLSAQAALAQEAPSEANIVRTPTFDLYLTEAPTVTFADVKTQVAAYDMGSVKKGQEFLIYAKAELSFKVLPYGCDTYFIDGEIVADVQEERDPWKKDPVTEVQLGSLWEIGTASFCMGVPPRPARIKLGVVNGTGLHFEKDRLMTYVFPGPENPETRKKSQWKVVILVNQATSKLEIQSIENVGI